MFNKELGANLAGKESAGGFIEQRTVPAKPSGAGSTSALSTVNSVRSNNTTNSYTRTAYADNQAIQQLRTSNQR